MYHRTYARTYATLLALLLCPALPNVAPAAHPPGLQPGDTYHVAFVTSSVTALDSSRSVPPANPAIWGGIPAADWVVSFHAAIGGLPGTETWDFATPIYQAILSDPSIPPGGVPPGTPPGANDAVTRLNISGPIYNRQNELVATGKADLFNNGISAPIKHDEFGFEVTGNLDVWSGTGSSGY